MKKFRLLILPALIYLISTISYMHGSNNKKVHLSKIQNLKNSVSGLLGSRFSGIKTELLGKTQNIRKLEEEATTETETNEGTESTTDEAPESSSSENKEEHEEEMNEGEGEECEEHEAKIPFFTIKGLTYFGIVIFLVCYAGIMSGLTVGFMGIDKLDLKIKMQTGTEEMKEQAKKILPVLKNHHMLLSTLLLNNAIAMEALPIFLDALVPSWMAILISTTAVLVFGEVLPQAICTGANQIKIAAWMAPIIRTLMKVGYPICKPIAMGLDYFLGVHGDKNFTKGELKALISIHTRTEHNKDGLTTDEVKIIQSTIDLRDQRVNKIMVPIEDVVMVPAEKKITERLITKMAKCGYSRIPIYQNQDKNNIHGVLVVKSMLDVQDDIGKSLVDSKAAKIEQAIVVYQDTNLLEMLNHFQVQKTRLAIVAQSSKYENVPKDDIDKMHNSIINVQYNRPKVIGVVCIRDLFSQLLKIKLTDNDIHKRYNLLSNDGFMKYNTFSARNQRRNEGMQEANEEEEFVEMSDQKTNLKKPLLHLSNDDQ